VLTPTSSYSWRSNSSSSSGIYLPLPLNHYTRRAWRSTERKLYSWEKTVQPYNIVIDWTATFAIRRFHDEIVYRVNRHVMADTPYRPLLHTSSNTVVRRLILVQLCGSEQVSVNDNDDDADSADVFVVLEVMPTEIAHSHRKMWTVKERPQLNGRVTYAFLKDDK